ncbi:hypothetical protein cyc_00760 [Cyclospora cayetanensis]|uniref:Uncharacterized protein n=1 Tax=Cyclospora cayetanensis TaxID=88456 RepID=A0A1D3CV14_9EIME|nr:hypothetical protein cyc_00760 [Cyclospora cayetanensis]
MAGKGMTLLFFRETALQSKVGIYPARTPHFALNHRHAQAREQLIIQGLASLCQIDLVTMAGLDIARAVAAEVLLKG